MEKINSGCLGFLARPEPGGLPGPFPYMARLLWAGSRGCTPHPPLPLKSGGHCWSPGTWGLQRLQEG